MYDTQALTNLETLTAIPSLKAYILVSQDKPLIELFERLEDNTWRYSHVGDEGVFSLPCLDLRLEVKQVYQGVKF